MTTRQRLEPVAPGHRLRHAGLQATPLPAHGIDLHIPASRHHDDVDPGSDDASHLVGTAAGSVVAALIAMGLGADDLAAVVSGAPDRSSPGSARHNLTLGSDPPSALKLRNLMRLMGPKDIMRSAGLAAQRRYRALWLHSLRPGTFDLARQPPFIPGMAWPWPMPSQHPVRFLA